MGAQIWWLAVFTVALAAWAARAQAPEPGPLTCVLRETSGVGGERLATVSLPLARGELPDLPAADVAGRDGSVAAQCRVLTRWGDGSVRRALVRFPWRASAGAGEEFTLSPGNTAAPAGLLEQALGGTLRLQAGPRTITADAYGLRIDRGDRLEARITALAPGWPERFVGPAVEAIENGPWFAWASLTWYSTAWNVAFEVRADWRGEIRLLCRLRMLQGGANPIPRFGLVIEGDDGDLRVGPEPNGLASPEAAPPPVPLDVPVADGGPRTVLVGDRGVVLPDGPQVRQGRLSISREEGGLRLAIVRDASLDSTVPDEHKQFFEGQERAVDVVLPPPGAPWLRCTVDVPAQRRCAAVMEQPLVAYGRLEPLRRRAAENALKLACRDGDQYGDLTSFVDVRSPRWTLQGLTRIDTGLDLLEDYYRGGDSRLRALALDWAENWVCLKQYRGSDRNSYGGERYTMVAWRSIPSYNQKGIGLIAYAYEETGDPRYLESVRAFCDRIVEQLRTRWFVASTAVAPTAIGGDANIRPGYLGRDLVAMYRWTGNAEYLQAARRILHGLYALRPEAPGLLREGYGDPYSPFDRLITGTDLGVMEDNSDHLKPFILNYLLEGAQAVFEETGDPVAEAMLRSLSDFMLDARQPGGIWNYAQRHAGTGNSIGHLSAEIANTLLRSYTLTGDERYREAAVDTYHLLCRAMETYGVLPGGVSVPPDRRYFYPDDRCELDFYRGEITIDGVGRDATGYFLSALDRLLRIDPHADEALLAPLTDPRQRWVVEEVPVAGDVVVPELGHCAIARFDLGREGDRESGGRSDLVLLEDGRPLGPPHSLHADIRNLGAGRYSHWTRDSLYFSASDNSDPRRNGRRYEFYYGAPEQIPPPEQRQVVPTAGRFPGRRPHPCVELYQAGVAAEQEGRWADAIAVWEQVLSRWPDSSPELYREIDLWAKLGDREQVIETCRRFLDRFPTHDRAPEVTLRWAGELLAGGDIAGAQAIYDRAVGRWSGTAWGEEAAARAWAECRVGEPPRWLIRAGREPLAPEPVTVLRSADGAPSVAPLRLGAWYDDAALTLRLEAPVPGGWPSDAAVETIRFIVEPRGLLTGYQAFEVNSAGGRRERGWMWHNRGEGYVAADGWRAEVSRDGAGWSATLVIPFEKLGVRPAPGHRIWRLGFRWDSLTGTMLWRPALPLHLRPHDCGWLAFE